MEMGLRSSDLSPTNLSNSIQRENTGLSCIGASETAAPRLIG
jgi:hypothetical protein